MSNVARAQKGESPFDKYGVVVDHFDPDKHISELMNGVESWVGPGGNLIKCLPALLLALNWRGTAYELVEALPPAGSTIDISAFRNLMVRLGFTSQVSSQPLKSGIHEAIVLVPHSGRPFVIVGTNEAGVAITYDSLSGDLTERDVTSVKGDAITFRVMDGLTTLSPKGWYTKILGRFIPLARHALLLSALVNVLALSIPLFVMLVYDRVIPSGSMSTLGHLSLGVMLALFMAILVRQVRRSIVNFVAARLSYLAGISIVNRLLSLPATMTEKASVGSQIARLRDLEKVRGFVSGPLGAAVLDIPFVTIFIAVIAIVSGWLFLVPLFAGGLFFVSGLAMARVVHANIERAARLNASRHELLIEIVQRLRAVRAAGGASAWIARFEKVSAQSAAANFKNARISSSISTLSQGVTLGAGLATVGFGVHMVIAGSMSAGGLIAAMMLVWRALSPMQGGFHLLARVDQLKASIRQTNRLLAMPPEKEVGLPMRGYAADVAFDRVTFRYPGVGDPALSGVSFAASLGEIVAVVGKNGAGKSSILKLISGLYTPLAGNIRIGGRDLRQINPRELRRLVSYVPQTPHLFSGTLLENLLLSNPLATKSEIDAAIEMAGATEVVEAMPLQLETVVNVRQTDQFSRSFLMRFSLARAYLRNSPIVLMDEPITGLDFESEFYFMAALDHLRKSATVILVTHRPSHLRAANKVLVLDNGAVRYFGAAEKVRDKIPTKLI